MQATPEMDGAVPVIAGLVSRLRGRVRLVSKCGPRVQARTLRWLAGHDFYARTGLPADQVRFLPGAAGQAAALPGAGADSFRR
jgi:hypothetical protein